MTPTEFLAKLADYGDADRCWIWTGALVKGYPYVTIGKRKRRAHRVTYEMLVGPIPDGLTLDHLCRRTSCINPRHLEPVTSKVNILRSEGPGAHNAAKTHCPQGHPYSRENTRLVSGRRECIECRRATWTRWNNRNRARGLQWSHGGLHELQRPLKTHCSRGHPFDTDKVPAGKRQRPCRVCQREYSRQHRLRKAHRAS
jgi:hypothetical protein